jgi:SAM-dependent methyltransferase
MRDWEVWDKPGMAEQIDAYWQGSVDEYRHRYDIAALVLKHYRAGESILEVGAGTGLVYDALAEVLGKSTNYIGLDNSKRMLGIAKQRFPGVAWRNGDAFALKYKDSAFDIGLAFEVFGHMPDCSGALAELLRVTKRVAMFTFWLHGGQSVRSGGEHYEYPAAWVVDRICETWPAGTFTMDIVELAPVAAFVVERR